MEVRRRAQARADETAMVEKSIERRLAERFEARLSEMVTSTLRGPMTATVSEPTTLTSEELNRSLAKWSNLSAQMKRSNVTIVVIEGYSDPIIMDRTATEGQFIEMSWRQAQALHEVWPLVLDRVIDQQTAHFRPAHQFDTLVQKMLPMPPFERNE